MKDIEEKEIKDFELVRPLPASSYTDQWDMPVIKAMSVQELNLKKLEPINFQNIKKDKDNSRKLILNYRYDEEMMRLWNHPLKYIPLLLSCGAVCTPDFSVSPQMNRHWLSQFVFRNRYLGCLWQDYGIKVIPTIPWCYPDTFDICFSGVEPGGVVCISTLGAKKNYNNFIEGFFEMRRRLKPSVIISYGKILPEMKGVFMPVDYKEAMGSKHEYFQIQLIEKQVFVERE